MPFPPPKEHRISMEDAARLTERFRQNHMGAVKAGLFPNDVYMRLLGNAHSAGIRIYFGQDEKGNICPVLCCVDAEGNDLLPAMAKGGDPGNELFDISFPCPPFCGDGNSLNGE